MFLGLKVYVFFSLPHLTGLCMVQLSFVLFSVAMVTVELSMTQGKLGIWEAYHPVSWERAGDSSFFLFLV